MTYSSAIWLQKFGCGSWGVSVVKRFTFIFSKPQFLHLYNEGNSTHSVGDLDELRDEGHEA